MGVDDAKLGLLVLQLGENTHQHDVFDDIGKAAGMKGVTVVHGRGVTTSGDESNHHWRLRQSASHPPRSGGITT
jgi:hypothetical protein